MLHGEQVRLRLDYTDFIPSTLCTYAEHRSRVPPRGALEALVSFFSETVQLVIPASIAWHHRGGEGAPGLKNTGALPGEVTVRGLTATRSQLAGLRERLLAVSSLRSMLHEGFLAPGTVSPHTVCLQVH